MCWTQNEHPAYSDQHLWQSRASYLLRPKFTTEVCTCRWREVCKINTLLVVFCCFFFFSFINNPVFKQIIHAVCSPWPPSNPLAQFCCWSKLVRHSKEQNYTFAAFRAWWFLTLIKGKRNKTGCFRDHQRSELSWWTSGLCYWWYTVTKLSTTQMHLGLITSLFYI